ncbi:WhiB family transcriptional regulator [Streptomyces scopuliridis]|uniref:WhiB family transcriptional regulator n=1 Tax=Streptomyces scopuliridis TaxID=452529 RepID=UPI003413DF2A
MFNMTATVARAARRDRLQAAISSRGHCVGTDPDLFFRSDSEKDTEWSARRAAAQAFCTSCPVRAACLELALRDGDGTGADDMVRAGVTGRQLVALRRRDGAEIEAAVAADRDDEWQQLAELTVAARSEALKNPDRRSAGGPRKSAQFQAAQNRRIYSLTEQIRTIRTARRARTGWGSAA